MGPIACTAVRHSKGKGALAQEEDLGAIETSWDSVRVAAGVLSGVGKARAAPMSSASAGPMRRESIASASVSALISEL